MWAEINGQIMYKGGACSAIKDRLYNTGLSCMYNNAHIWKTVI